MVKSFLYTLIFLFAIIPCNAQNTLELQLNGLLKDEQIASSEVGIAVFDLTANQSLFNYQEKKLYRPASIEKLITGITGLSCLGINHTFDTSLYYSGSIAGNMLNGDLYISGGFDPLFEEQGMDFLVSLIDSMGIKQINGNVIGDISMTDSLYWGPGWSWDDTPFDFQPYMSPLMYYKGCVEITALPAQKNMPAKLIAVPVSTFYTIENQTKSNAPSAGKFTVTRNWLENGNRITVGGNVDTPRKDGVNIFTSKDFFMHAFREKLMKKGIRVDNYVWNTQPVSKPVEYIGKYSHTMTDVLKPAMKKSDNLCAEAIFYHLAAKNSGKKKVGNKEGSDAILGFIKRMGFNDRNYKIVDGSGVSLYNYITPELILAYLKYAYSNQEIYKYLYETLPVAGIDGTLANRMKQGKAYGNVRAKTGSVTGVSSLAGYVKAANGHMLAFVIINQNILEQGKARSFQERVCELLSNLD